MKDSNTTARPDNRRIPLRVTWRPERLTIQLGRHQAPRIDQVGRRRRGRGGHCARLVRNSLASVVSIILDTCLRRLRHDAPEGFATPHHPGSRGAFRRGGEWTCRAGDGGRQGFRRTRPRTEHRVHPRRRSGLGRSQQLRAPRLRDGGARQARASRRAADAGVRQLLDLHADPHRLLHRALSAEAARRVAGAARLGQLIAAWLAGHSARAPHDRVAAAGARVPHGVDRQVARGLLAHVQPQQERLRAVLRHLQRRRRLLHAQGRRWRARPVGGRDARSKRPATSPI